MSLVVRTLTALLVVSACTSATPPSAAGPTEQPVRGGVIVEPITSDIKTLQFTLASDTASGRATELLYDNLVDWDNQSGEPRPRLGSWQISADGRTYAWEINAAAAWTDGVPVTGADVLASYKAIARSKKTTKKRFFTNIDGFNEFASGLAGDIAGVTIDPSEPRRFTVRLIQARCSALLDMFALPPLPAHVFGRYLTTPPGPAFDDIDRAPENDAPTVTNGPFRLREWRRGEHVSLVRNPSYFRGAPLLDGYEFKVMTFDRALWTEHLRSGRIGYLTINPDDVVLMESVAREPGLKLSITSGNGYTFWGWNTRSTTAPALRDRRIRQALAYGLDTLSAIRAVIPGSTRLVAHHLPNQWAYPSGLETYSYDPVRARRLIEEAGYVLGSDGYYARDGVQLGFRLETNKGNPGRVALAQLTADEYRKIGVRVTPVPIDFADLVERATGAADIEAFILGWSLLPEPDGAFGIWHSSSVPDPDARRTGNNLARFASSAADAALEAARNGPDCSLAARKKHYETFNRVLNEEQPYNFGFAPPRYRVTSASLRGFEPGPWHDHLDVHKWWLASEKK